MKISQFPHTLPFHKRPIFFSIFSLRGLLKIAEVESRFYDDKAKTSEKSINSFCKSLSKFGFKCKLKSLEHKMFVFMDFKKEFHFKPTDDKGNVKELPQLELQPCLYKKR